MAKVQADLIERLERARTGAEETLDIIRSDPSVLLWGRKVPEREFEK